MVGKSNIKAVIWDMGGVILKTVDPNPRIQLAKRFAMDRIELEDVVFSSESSKKAELGLITEEEHLYYIRTQLNIHDEMENFLFEFWAGDRIDEVLVEFIHSIRSRYKTGLLSNAWSNTRHNINKHFDILDAFDISLFSAEVEMAKPDPEIYKFILNKLEVLPHEAIFIDDFQENVVGAEMVGIKAIHFDNTESVIRQINTICDL